MTQSPGNDILRGKRRAWLGLIWAIGLTCVLVLPDVDESLRDYRELGVLRAELVERSHLPDRSRMLAERVDQSRAAMTGMEAALVSETKLSTFKQHITNMVNDAGCHLLSIRPGAVAVLPLDNVLDSDGSGPSKSPQESSWEARVQTSLISVAGSFTHHAALMSALDREPRILNLASLDLHRSTESAETLALDLQIQTFNLREVVVK